MPQTIERTSAFPFFGLYTGFKFDFGLYLLEVVGWLQSTIKLPLNIFTGNPC